MTVLLPPPEEEEDGRRGGQLCGRRPRERKRQKKYKGDFEGDGNHHYRTLLHSSSSSSSATANCGEKTEDARGRGGHCFKEEDDDDDEDGRGCHHDHQQQQQQHSSHRFVNHHNHRHHQQHHHLHLQHHLKRWWRSWPRSPPLLSSLPSPPSLPSSSSLSSSRRQLSANEINRRRSSRSDCRQYGSLLKRRGGTAVFQHLLIAVAISIVLFTGGTLAIAKDGDKLLQPGHHQHHQMSPSLEGFSDLKEDLMFEDSLDVATSHYLSDDGQADRVVMSSSDGRVINSSTVYRQIESPNAIPGDHILRPFSRREKRNQLHTQQQQQGQQIPPQPQLNPRNTNAFRRHQLSSQDFSLPVVDLKRISGDSNNRYPNNQLVPPHQGPGPFFKKRLPLMEEGFLLSPAPNSAGSLERRQDFVQEERHPVRGSRGTSSDSFRRRFGDGLAHESVNFNSNGGGGSSHGSGEVSTGDQHHHHHHLRAFLEDSDDNELSLNDLDLDDIAGPMPPQQGQRGLANHPKTGHHPNHNNNHPHQHHHHSHSHNHNHHHHHTAHQQQNFKALRKPIRSAQFGGDHGSAVLPPPPPPPPSSSAVPPSPSTSTGGGNPAPSGAPISQIMPLFFDKFLAEFGNAHLPPLSPEGFSLPPSPASPVAPPPPPPTSSADLEASRGGGPPSSTLPGGIHLKPEIGPPLFSNDLVQPSPPPPPPPPPSSAEFGGDGGGGSSPAVSSGPPWPKIFRFTDGRINLHDFEREKKRSRVKFSAKLQMASKAALYNIKRESFLILHGGTFSQ